MPARELSFDDGMFLSYDDLGSIRKEKFLGKLGDLVPWQEMESIIEPYYRQAGNRGQQPYPLDLMLRIHVFQIVYNLSDPMAEETLRDSISVRRFVGLRMDSSTPDETTILRFRRLLEKKALSNKIFNMITGKLKKRGMLISKGTIVDASFIDAPSSTKNRTKSRDPEMSSGKKGNTYHFGMKLHIGVDKHSGIAHTMTTTGANVHDIVEVDKLRRKDDWEVMGDAGYIGMEKRKSADPEHVTYTAAKRYGQRKKMSERQKEAEHTISSVRCKVEHVFHRIKRQFGYWKVRYRGLYKNKCRLEMLLSLANLLIADGYERRCVCAL